MLVGYILFDIIHGLKLKSLEKKLERFVKKCIGDHYDEQVELGVLKEGENIDTVLRMEDICPIDDGDMYYNLLMTITKMRSEQYQPNTVIAYLQFITFRYSNKIKEVEEDE